MKSRGLSRSTLPRRQLLTLSLLTSFFLSLSIALTSKRALRLLNGPLSLSDIRQKKDMSRTSRHMTHDTIYRRRVQSVVSGQSVLGRSVGPSAKRSVQFSDETGRREFFREKTPAAE